jgi:SWI/SNF-related matrix-associated actin-dependent regulator of chromatin subfamily A member 5
MIRFGADAIFNAKGSTITDDDVDVLLSRGEMRTQAFSDKLKENTNNLLNFSMTEGGNYLNNSMFTEPGNN